MEFDIIVNGRKVGVAKVSVDIPKNLQDRHVVTEKQVLECLKTGEPQNWYCMGAIEVKPKEIPFTR